MKPAPRMYFRCVECGKEFTIKSTVAYHSESSGHILYNVRMGVRA
jgi:hypothetical protein